MKTLGVGEVPAPVGSELGAAAPLPPPFPRSWDEGSFPRKFSKIESLFWAYFRSATKEKITYRIYSKHV